MQQLRSTHSTRKTACSTPVILPVMLLVVLATQQPARLSADDDTFTQVLQLNKNASAQLKLPQKLQFQFLLAVLEVVLAYSLA